MNPKNFYTWFIVAHLKTYQKVFSNLIVNWKLTTTSLYDDTIRYVACLFVSTLHIFVQSALHMIQMSMLSLRPVCESKSYVQVMMTSSNGKIFRVTGHLCGNSPVPGEFLTQRPVTRSFDVFFDLRLNKRLSKQSWGWWFETLSRSLWRHRNGWS